MQYLIAYDFGTTGVKTCLFGAEQDIRLIASAYAGYGLYILPDGGAEQDADEWWDAMCRTTKAVFEKTDVTPAQVTGISFCSQMQGMVLVDEYGRALRRPMSYMDQRASAEFKACQTHGPCVSGCEHRDAAALFARDARRVHKRQGPALEIQMGAGARAGGLPKGAQMAGREGISDCVLHG